MHSEKSAISLSLWVALSNLGSLLIVGVKNSVRPSHLFDHQLASSPHLTRVHESMCFSKDETGAALTVARYLLTRGCPISRFLARSGAFQTDGNCSFARAFIFNPPYMPINTILGDVSLRGIEVLKNRVTQISPRHLSERSAGALLCSPEELQPQNSDSHSCDRHRHSNAHIILECDLNFRPSFFNHDNVRYRSGYSQISCQRTCHRQQ